jgi:hypothetical protein
MKHHHHAQHPFDQEIRRRLFQDRREARVQAGWDFLRALVLSTAIVSVITLIVVTLTE